MKTKERTAASCLILASANISRSIQKKIYQEIIDHHSRIAGGDAALPTLRWRTSGVSSRQIFSKRLLAWLGEWGQSTLTLESCSLLNESHTPKKTGIAQRGDEDIYTVLLCAQDNCWIQNYILMNDPFSPPTPISYFLFLPCNLLVTTDPEDNNMATTTSNLLLLLLSSTSLH